MLERVMGIEPTWSAWEAEVLPLNYTRDLRIGPFGPIRATTIYKAGSAGLKRLRSCVAGAKLWYRRPGHENRW